MDVQEVISRYRSAPIIQRLALVSALALASPIYLYITMGDEKTIELDNARSANQDAKAKFGRAKKTKSDLVLVQERYSVIEQMLARAKKYLPDKIEIDEVLGIAAGFEKELNIRLQNFGPEKEAAPNTANQPIGGIANLALNKPGVAIGNENANYREILLKVEVKSEFRKIMSFFDRLVHLERVTHLRAIEFTSENPTMNILGEATGKADLILFESRSL